MRKLALLALLALAAAPAQAQFVNIYCGNGPCADLVDTALRVKIISAPTLTVSGTVAATQSGGWSVTANAGTNLNTSTLALESGGNLAAIASALAGTITVSGTVTVTDGAGALNVIVDSGTTAVTNAGTFATQIVEGGVTADVLDLTNSNPLTVGIVDGSGNQITSFGGGTQYTEGDTDATITGTVTMWEDTGNAIVATSAAKPFPVEIIAGAGSGGTAMPDDDAFTGGTTNVTPMGALYDTTPPSVTDGSIGAPRMNDDRILMVDVASVTAAGTVDDTATLTPGTTDGTPIMGAVTTDDVDAGDIGIVAMTDDRALHVNLRAGDGSEVGVATLAEQQSQTTHLGNIATSVGTLDNAISGSEMQVDVVTMPTTTVTATNLDVQIGGSDTVTVTSAQTGSGTATGAIRVELPTNGTGILATVGTVTNLTNLPNEGQQTAANSISVTPDTDNDAVGATGSAVPGEAVYIAGTDGTNTTPYYVDPCQRKAKTYFVVDIVTATTTEIANQVASEFFYICSINLIAGGAQNVAIVEDDTDTCGSPTAGLNGGVTAGEGWNFAANGGIALGDGSSTVMKTSTANRYFCIITSAAQQLSGTIAYVSAP